MQIKVSGKNVEVTDALRAYAEEKLGKVSKYSDSVISADITFSTERSWHIVEVTLFASGAVLRGEERTGDMYASIDSVVGKLEKQLKKQKEKVAKKPRGGGLGSAYEGAAAYEPPKKGVDEEEETFTEEVLNENVEVVRRFNPKPMHMKEAILEMESLGYGFYVFVSAENARVNVVYKRPKGYGLIDPILE
jgi:putative sigma-54 modulation protein